MDRFDALDILIVAGYLIGITVLGLVASRRSTRSSESYFLAGRSLSWPTIGLALFATNISTVHLIGLASAGFGDGMVLGNFEWLAATCLILLGLVFAPFYFKSQVATLPEYLERRYGPAARTMLAVMALAGALMIHIGVTLYAGATVVHEFLPLEAPSWYEPFGNAVPFHVGVSILIVSALTVLYTVLGGLRAVVVTESVQTIVLLAGAFAVTAFGIAALHAQGITTLSALQAATKPRQMSMVHADGGYAWYALLLGYPVLGIWYWCSDQTIVQRVLGARTERDARLGPIFAGFLKILPVPLMVLPGVMAYALFREEIGANPDRALVVLILELLPHGLRGLVMAGLLAALMSTVAGALNSTSTLVSIDIVKRIKPDIADRSLVRIGQVTAVIVMVLAMAWSTQGERFGGIFQGINAMIAVLAPPISAVFLWGVLWRRGTARGAFATLLFGFALGVLIFLVDFPAVSSFWFGRNTAGEPIQFVTHTLGIPFLLQAWWSFVICSVFYGVVSLTSPAPDPEIVDRYCVTPRSFTWDHAHAWSVVLLMILAVLYLILR